VNREESRQTDSIEMAFRAMFESPQSQIDKAHQTSEKHLIASLPCDLLEQLQVEDSVHSPKGPMSQAIVYKATSRRVPELIENLDQQTSCSIEQQVICLSKSHRHLRA
jgi:hypothetical protein